MKLTIVMAAVAAACVLATTAGASGTTGLTKHDNDVIRFFDHHPRLAATPAGGRSLRHIIHRAVNTIRSLQAARAALPTTWRDSVNYVGRYFGSATAAWELSCSSTEGGWGGFQWFRGLSYPVYGYSNTPGGQMQFMGGTFDGIIDKAIVTARARGMTVPASARSLYSPLGQAVAGAQMVIDGRTGEWSGSGC